MANIGGPQSSTENAIKIAASTSTSAASSRGIYWPDRVMTLLLEAVREKESLWNTKSEAYKNRNVKKVQYEEVLQLIKEELPDVDFMPPLGVQSHYWRTKLQTVDNYLLCHLHYQIYLSHKNCSCKRGLIQRFISSQIIPKNYQFNLLIALDLMPDSYKNHCQMNFCFLFVYQFTFASIFVCA